MNKLLIALAMAGLAAPVAAQQLPPAVIITINTRDVISNSAAFKAAQPELKQRVDAAQQRLNILRTSLQAEEKTLRDSQPQQGAPAAAVQAWQAKAREYQAKAQQAEEELQRRQGELQASEQWVIRQINDATQPIIQQVMRERGANIAIDEQLTLAHGQAIDVSADVLARLDKALPKVSTTPPAPPAAAAPAAAPAAAAPRPAPAPATPPRR
jgi:Skp family chaperone for outer membrane proteins